MTSSPRRSTMLQRKIVFFILNRDASGSAEVSLDLQGSRRQPAAPPWQISGPDLLATNTERTA